MCFDRKLRPVDSHLIICCIWRSVGWRLHFGVICVCVLLKVGHCITGDSVEDTKAALCPGHVMPVWKAPTMWSCFTECWVELANAASPLRCEHDREKDWEGNDTEPLKKEDVEKRVWTTKQEMKAIECNNPTVQTACNSLIRSLLTIYLMVLWEGGCLLWSQFVGMWRFCKDKKQWLTWIKNVS